MCEVKGGCTCGNEYCQDDDFDVAALAPIKVTEISNGRKIFEVDIGNMTPEQAMDFIDKVTTDFAKPTV